MTNLMFLVAIYVFPYAIFFSPHKKSLMIESLQISYQASVILLKHQKRSWFLHGYIANFIVAFTVLLLLFFWAWTAFDLDTFLVT